ncbi:MAG: PadR family transcriptional regulator [Actinobacteria bacterium]|nr:PadR family transcriptional regulator [Actinomycetota bacterium]
MRPIRPDSHHHMHRPPETMGAPGHRPPGRLFGRGGIKFAILAHLKERPSHGYDIIRQMEERSGGFYSPSPGTIYPNLQALEDQGFVSVAAEEGKKIYSITEAGLAFLDEHKERAKSHRERWEASWGPGPDGEGWAAMKDIRNVSGDIRRAVRTIAGDSGKLKEIGAVLREAAVQIKEIVER